MRGPGERGHQASLRFCQGAISRAEKNTHRLLVTCGLANLFVVRGASAYPTFVLLALELDIDIINRINSNTPTIPHIIDPSCGSGTFLIEAMKLITSSVLHPRPGLPSVSKSRRAKDFIQEWFQPNAQNHNIQNRWARQFIYGVEANGDLALATKVNMIVHGDGNANIFKNDGLAPFAKFEPTKDNLNTRLQLEGWGGQACQPTLQKIVQRTI